MPPVAVSPRSDATTLFVLSQDALTGTRIPPELSLGWNDRPPLFHAAKDRRYHKMLMDLERRGAGVPPALRCAVWTLSIVGECNPHESKGHAEGYGTLGMVGHLERGYGLALGQTFPDESDLEDTCSLRPPFLGLDADQMDSLLNYSQGGTPIPPLGVKSLTKVLTTVRHVLGVEYCPLLPDVTAILLSHCSESHAYFAIREMLHESARYLPISREDHYAHCKTFADLLRKLYPATAKEMDRCDALSLDKGGLDPIFKRFFVPIFKREHVLRFMDLFAIEGKKLMFRMGSALIQMIEEKFFFRNVTDAKTYWNGVRDYCRSDKFDFDLLIKKAYGLHGTTGVGRGRLLRRRKFPNRQRIARMARYNEGWVEENFEMEVAVEEPVKPLGVVRGEVQVELATPPPVRAALAQWLPPIYRGCRLDLIYSTNAHGRTLSQFYEKVCRTKRTVTLVEVLSTGSVVGMFASHAWRANPQVYGDGECFLFRCAPDPECFKWRPKDPGSIDDDESENEALMEQFMVSNDTFLSMGGNKDGTSGLRLNEDLTRGESSPAVGFNNAPLAGEENRDFEVGLVEVYRLVREVDGKAVGGEEGDSVWNFDA